MTYLRNIQERTLADLRSEVATDIETISRPGQDVRLHLTGEEKVIEFSESEITIPATEQSVQALGSWLDVPTKFLSRLENDTAESLINDLLRRNYQPGNFEFNRTGLQAVRDPRRLNLRPEQILAKAAAVLPADAQVIDWNLSADEMLASIVVPDGFDRGIGGDRKVGDLTKGGVRFGADFKHNLSPWASTFAFRLACTNGMESRQDDFKIDSRGGTADEILSEFEAIVARSFSRTEERIADFYALRQERVANPERELRRLAEEQGLPDRTILRLIERAPMLGLDGDGVEQPVSMFDLVNLVTNQANAPGVRPGARRTLEAAGGTIATTHVERCGHCRTKLH